MVLGAATMKVIGGITTIFIGVIVVAAMGQPDQRSTTSTVKRVDTSCSKAAVALPSVVDQTSLAQCQSTVRAYVKAMIANVRVTATCREEFVQRTGPNLPAADTVRNASRELIKMIPDLERGAAEQIKTKMTLAQCREHLSAAQKLVSLQPELRGDWSASLRQ
jgi:hypothetical protein